MAQGCRSKQAISDTRMLWHSVISEPQGVLFRSMADREVEIPSRLHGPQMLDSTGAGHRTSWLWPHRDVSFHVADSAISSIAFAAFCYPFDLEPTMVECRSQADLRVPFPTGYMYICEER